MADLLATLLAENASRPPLDLHERLLTEAGVHEPETAARFFVEAAQAALEGGDVDASLAAAERASALAAEPETQALARVSLAVALMVAGRATEATRLLDEWAGAAGSDRLFQAAMRTAGLLFWLEQYGEAAVLLERLVDAARVSGRLDRVARPLDTLASLDYRQGRWRRAEARSREALRLARLSGSRFDIGSALTTQARVAAARGDEGSCRTLLEAARRASEGDSLVGRYAATAEALLELTLDRPDTVIALLEPMAEVPLARNEPAVFLWEADLVEAYLRVGRRTDAEAAQSRFERRAATTGRRWARAAAARCRGLLAPAEELDEHFQAALAADVDTPFERARTQLAYGTRLRRSRRQGPARDQLRPALATFELLLAEPWAGRARRELATRADRRAAAASPVEALLTAHELQVATLVGGGATNREAAAALFVTPKTIEYHLASVYRKLGVRNRTELAIALAAPPMPPR